MSDKGAEIVVHYTSEYLYTGYEYLSDTEIYQELSADPISETDGTVVDTNWAFYACIQIRDTHVYLFVRV